MKSQLSLVSFPDHFSLHVEGKEKSGEQPFLFFFVPCGCKN